MRELQGEQTFLCRCVVDHYASSSHSNSIISRMCLKSVRHGYHTLFLLPCSKVMTTQESGITNGIEIFDCGSPSDVKLVAANNDDKVRVFPADRFDSCR